MCDNMDMAESPVSKRRTDAVILIVGQTYRILLLDGSYPQFFALRRLNLVSNF